MHWKAGVHRQSTEVSTDTVSKAGLKGRSSTALQEAQDSVLPVGKETTGEGASPEDLQTTAGIDTKREGKSKEPVSSGQMQRMISHYLISRFQWKGRPASWRRS